MAVIDGHGDGVGNLLATLQGLDLVAGVIQLVLPVAVLVDGERAVSALAVVVDGPGVLVVDVHVGHVQLATGGGGAVFGDCAVGFAGQRRLVVGAVDGDRDGALRAVSGGDREGLGQLLADAQGLDLGIGVVQGVLPVAVGVDGELAVLALGIGLGLEDGFARVLVRHVQLAAGGGDLVFLDRALVVIVLAGGDDGGVVGAGDINRDDLGGGAAMAVVDGHGDGVGDLLAFLQGLDFVAAIVQRVGPLARAVDGEAAIRPLAVVADGPAVGVVGVDVMLGQLTRDRGVGAIFLDAAGGRARDGRGIVGAGDRDGDDLRGFAAMAVVDGHGDGVGHLLALCQGLDLLAVVVQRVDPLAVLVEGEAAVLALAVVVERPGVGVGGVDVVLGQLTRHFLGAIFRDVTGGLAGDGRNIVGAVDGDRDRAGGAVGGGDREGLLQRLARGQRLYARVGLVQAVDPVAVGVDRERAIDARTVGHCYEEGLAVVGVDYVELAIGGGDFVFLDRAGVVARLGGGDQGRVIDADHGDFHGGGRGRAARIGDHVGNRGGSGLPLGQVLEAGARDEHVAAVRLHDEGAAVGTGDRDAAGGHGAAIDRDDAQRIAIGIAVVGQQVAAHGGLFIDAGGIVDGDGCVIGVAGVASAAAAAGRAVQRVNAAARVGVGQVQRAGRFQDAGQAHEAAAAVVAAAARQGGGRGVQDFKRILPSLQGGQQAVGVGARGRSDRRFGRVGQGAGQVAADSNFAAFPDHDRHAVLDLQGHRRARGGNDVAAGGHVAALPQFGQGPVAIAYPCATGEFSDDCGRRVGHVGSVSGSYPRWPDTRGG